MRGDFRQILKTHLHTDRIVVGMTWPISSIDIACMHHRHRRRSLKTVLHAHRMTIIVPLHYRHLHIMHSIYRAPMYPEAGDLQTR